MMVVLEYCSGGNLKKALQRDARDSQRRLVVPYIEPAPPRFLDLPGFLDIYRLRVLFGTLPQSA
jgi:hypothetical protein